MNPYIPPFPSFFKKIAPVAVLLSTLLLASLIPWSALQAQETENSLDPVDQEFSGPLAVIPEMVTVGDPGNPADPATGFGAVAEAFQIGKYDVTVLQWATFLNAVHVVEGNLQDPRNLYHQEMLQGEKPTSFLTTASGIIKKTIQKEYGIEIYDEKATLFFPKEWGRPLGHYYASLPITGISIDDCKRYLNWLHNGSPHFENLTEATLLATETGAYDFTNGNNGKLMKGARYFLPTLHQWYKAAYYQAGSSNGGYWKYPTQGNILPVQTASYRLQYETDLKTGANFATTSSAWPHPKFYYEEEKIKGMPLTTPVGAFKDSAGPYGTYDMGGNVRQWSGDVLTHQELYASKVLKKSSSFLAPGGSYDEKSDQLLSTKALKSFPSPAGNRTIGLRVAATINSSNEAALFPSELPEMITTHAAAFDPTTVLFAQALLNVTFAQLTAYGLEASLGYAFRNQRTFEEIIKPFTYQRNIVNTIMSITLATSTTGEAHCMTIKKADCWNIAFLVASTVATMIGTETGAFVVEAFVGKGLELLKAYGLDLTVQKSLDVIAWPRIFTNIWYIGCNTYLTTESDLAYFNEQQKKAHLQQP